jgi:Sec-independent protein translocase protein TatA
VPDLLLVLLIILGVVIYVRGPKVLPGLGAALGGWVREARHAATRGLGNSDDDGDTPAPPA